MDSRLCDLADSSMVFTWNLEEEKDELGNMDRYVYDRVTRTSPATGLAEKGRAPACASPARPSERSSINVNLKKEGGFTFTNYFPPCSPPRHR